MYLFIYLLFLSYIHQNVYNILKIILFTLTLLISDIITILYTPRALLYLQMCNCNLIHYYKKLPAIKFYGQETDKLYLLLTGSSKRSHMLLLYCSNAANTGLTN